MYASGEMGLACSPKPDRKDTALQQLLQRQSQALGKDFTPRPGSRTGSEPLGAHSFLCSQLRDQVMSCRKPRSVSLISSSLTAANGMLGPSTPTTCVLATHRVASTPARYECAVGQPAPSSKGTPSPPCRHRPARALPGKSLLHPGVPSTGGVSFPFPISVGLCPVPVFPRPGTLPRGPDAGSSMLCPSRITLQIREGALLHRHPTVPS